VHEKEARAVIDALVAHGTDDGIDLTLDQHEIAVIRITPHACMCS